MAPTKYGDFSKSVDDLLRNDYFFNNKLKVKTKTKDGYEITSETVHKGSMTSLSGKVTAKVPLDKNITLNKIGVSYDGRVVVDAAYGNVLPGLSLSTLIEDGGKKGSVGELGATYKHDMFTLKVKVDALNGPTVKESVSTQHKDFLLGAEVKYNTGLQAKGSKAGLLDFSAGISYVHKDFTVTLKALKKLSKVEASVYHKHNQNFEIGANLTAGKSSPLLTVGGLYKIDKSSSAQAKVTSGGVFSANFIKKYGKNLKVILSSTSSGSGSFAEKFGLQLQLS